MKLFIETLVIFFATLLVAALVALGEPGSAREPAPARAQTVQTTTPAEPAETFALVRWLGFR